MLKIGTLYKKYRQIGDVHAYRMCKVISETEHGWLVDLGDGNKIEISEKEAEKLVEVR